MNQLTDEQKKIWTKYYSNLTADELMQAVIDCNIVVRFSKPGVISCFEIKAAGLQHNYQTLIPGAIWRSQATHRQVPEPKDKDIQKLLDRYYSHDFMTIPIWQANRGEKHYSYYKEEQAEPLTNYLTYHPLVLKRIYELTEPLLYGQREDVQQLVTSYQGGDREMLPRIKNQLGGIIDKAVKEFSYSGDKEVFTNLAGKFNKKLPKPKSQYSENSPAGDVEDQRLFLIMEPFKFAEDDLQAVIEKAVIDALDSYKFNQGAQFKTWFYRIFNSDLIDLYREYQRKAKRGSIVKSLTEDLPPGNHSFNKTINDYRAYLSSIRSEESEIGEYMHPNFIDQLSKNQYNWIDLNFKMQPNILSVNLAADLLNISLSTEYRLRDKLHYLMLSRFRWSLPVFISDRKVKNPETVKVEPAAACNNSGCNICTDLFPNVNIKYRPCYSRVKVKKVERAVSNNTKVTPVNAVKGGYFWPAAKKDYELKEAYYDRLKRIT